MLIQKPNRRRGARAQIVVGLAAEMAATLAQLSYSKGLPILTADVVRAGFTPREIPEHGDDAVALFARANPRLVVELAW